MGGDLTSVRGLSNGKSLSMSATSRSPFGMPTPPPGSHGQPSGDPREVLTLDHFEGAVERSPFATQLGASRAHRRPRTIPSPRSLALRDLTAVDAGQGVMGDGLVRRAGVRGLRIRAGIGVGDTYIYGHRPSPCILGLIWSIYRFIRARSPSPRPWAPRWRAISTVTVTTSRSREQC